MLVVVGVLRAVPGQSALRSVRLELRARQRRRLSNRVECMRIIVVNVAGAPVRRQHGANRRMRLCRDAGLSLLVRRAQRADVAQRRQRRTDVGGARRLVRGAVLALHRELCRRRDAERNAALVDDAVQ